MKNKEYRPPKWISIFITITCVIIPIVIILLAGVKLNLANIFLTVLSIMGAVGLVDLKNSKITIRKNEIDIIGLFKKEKISIDEIDYVQLEDRKAYIKPKDGRWQHLPNWFSNHKSFYRIIKNRISKEMV